MQYISKKNLYLIILITNPITAIASEKPNNTNAITLPTTVVTANILAPEMGQFATGASVIGKNALQQNFHSTLGDLLSHTTGVSSDTFGQGATRPIIRGQTAPRVKVIQQGLTVNDASQISPDHQVSIDVNNAKQIEVIKGASTLMYGGGAIGGVVNVVDDLITSRPEKHKKQLNGNLSTVVNQASNGYRTSARLQGTHQNMIATATINKADHGNYRVPHWDSNKIDSSWYLQNNIGLGLSYLLQNGHIGLAYQNLASEYGLPGHSHNSCEPSSTNANQLDCGGHHHHDHAHGEPPYVDLNNHIYRFSYAQKQHPYLQQINLQEINIKASHTDYAHDESDEGKVATSFKNKAFSSRIDAKHMPIASQSGYFTGILGADYNVSDFSAIGNEKFIPKTKTNTFGVYLIERYSPTDQTSISQLTNKSDSHHHSQHSHNHEHNHDHTATDNNNATKAKIQNSDWYMELGLRQDFSQIDNIENNTQRDFSNTSASIEAGKTLFDGHKISARLSHSARTPTAQELYAQGAHIATNTYERGNPQLKSEQTNALELSYQGFFDDMDIKTTVFASLSSDYIYAKTTDMNDSGVRLIDYIGADAKSYGAEIEARYYVNDIVSIGGFADTAILSVKDKTWSDAPRVPASRVGGDIEADWFDWQASLSGYHRFRQNRVANFETITPSYNMLNAKLTYQGLKNYQLFIAGTNLLNELAYNHASYLVDKTPKAGRSVNAGFTYQF